MAKDIPDHIAALMESPYFRHTDIGNGELGDSMVATIKRVDPKVQTNFGKKQTLVYFEEHEKPLGLNNTNIKSLGAIITVKWKGWAGKKVTLFVTETSSRDGIVPCVRIRECKPEVAQLRAVDSLTDAVERFHELIKDKPASFLKSIKMEKYVDDKKGLEALGLDRLNKGIAFIEGQEALRDAMEEG